MITGSDTPTHNAGFVEVWDGVTGKKRLLCRYEGNGETPWCGRGTCSYCNKWWDWSDRWYSRKKAKSQIKEYEEGIEFFAASIVFVEGQRDKPPYKSEQADKYIQVWQETILELQGKLEKAKALLTK